MSHARSNAKATFACNHENRKAHAQRGHATQQTIFKITKLGAIVTVLHFLDRHSHETFYPEINPFGEKGFLSN